MTTGGWIRERAIKLHEEIAALEKRLRRAKDADERRRLKAQLKPLRREVAQLDPRGVLAPKPIKKRGTQSPKSYFEAIRAKREAAHAVSGFNRIRARFVQGGGGGG